MVLIGDMSSIFTVGWISGLTTLLVTKNDTKARKSRHIIYICFAMTVYVIAAAVLLFYILKYKDSDWKGTFTTVMRVFCLYLCVPTDAFLTTLWNWKISSVLSRLRTFDRVTKFSQPSKRNKLRIICRVTVTVNFVYSAISGYLTYRVEEKIRIFRSVAYFTTLYSINTQIIIFVCFVYLIQERFRHLCYMLTFPKEDKLTISARSNGHYTLQQIWWLHCSLVNATEMINSVYAIQLLFWVLTMSINVLSRMYSLNVHKLSDYGNIRETMLVIACIWNLLLITNICHTTAYQANRVGELLFTPYSSASMKQVFIQENLEAASYFQLRKVHFVTIAGVIRVDLPLLLSIFSALTTYLVILA
ncbi:hypothetical protein WH47_09640 [Habropoda laboriosa]|uniref:Gustatory receptor n=1 Tax=Habropoda laboriosa TaxID=597456 RepID=A0A0L7RE08_9HYME|nr:hypothetical protein WH47_09640 [Habropoda laboriosa]